MLPIGTHQWDRFLRPEELGSALSAAGLVVDEPVRGRHRVVSRDRRGRDDSKRGDAREDRPPPDGLLRCDSRRGKLADRTRNQHEEARSADDALALDGAVDKVSFAGREAFYRVRLHGGTQVLAHVHRPDRRLLEQAGARVRLVLPVAHLHLFDPATGRRIGAAS